MARRWRILIFSLLSLACIAFILSNSLENGPESMDHSGRFLAFFKPLLDPKNVIEDKLFHAVLRKCAHLTEFAMLGVCLFGLSDALSWKRKWLLWVFPLSVGLLVAGLDEFLQRFTGRTSAFKDVLIDFSGVLLGVCIAAFFRFLLRRHRMKSKQKIKQKKVK